MKKIYDVCITNVPTYGCDFFDICEEFTSDEEFIQFLEEVAPEQTDVFEECVELIKNGTYEIMEEDDGRVFAVNRDDLTTLK